MKKILPFLCLSMFLATSCEDDEVTCTDKLNDLAAMPFNEQLQNLDLMSTEAPENWESNCEAYVAEYQKAFDDGCLPDEVTQEVVDGVDEMCHIFDES